MKAGLILTGAALLLSQAASASVIGDFEGGFDGFANIGTAGLSVDGTTASLGVSSLGVADTGTGWSQSIRGTLTTVWNSEVAPGGTLSIDIKAAGGAPSVPAWWLQVIPVINSQNGGWTQLAAGSPVLNGQWQTLTWTYPATAATAGDWAELFIITNSSDVRNYNIDNVRLTVAPEPVSAMAMLWALLPLARRRR